MVSKFIRNSHKKPLIMAVMKINSGSYKYDQKREHIDGKKNMLTYTTTAHNNRNKGGNKK